MSPTDSELLEHSTRESQKNLSLNWTNIKVILPKCFFLVFNLAIVYFFEYCIISCFADRIQIKLAEEYPDKNSQPFSVRQFFVILNSCYQIGVFISRSSLQLVKIRKVWILSVIQGANFVFMFLNTRFLWITSLGFLCPLFIWIGLMGGGSYVNVYHIILESKTLRPNEKESVMIISQMFNDIGVLSSAIFTLVIDNTLFSTKK